MEQSLNRHKLGAHVSNLQNMSLQISKQICQLRTKCKSDFFSRQCLFKIVDQNPDHSYGLCKVLSVINTNLADCENVICHGLDINQEIACEISKSLAVPNLIPDGHHVTLLQQPNTFCLQSLEEIEQIMDVTNADNFMYVPQRSSLWYDIRKKVRLTGSTFGKAIGLNRLSAQKEHHHIFVNCHKPAPISEEVQKMLDHGTNFKIRGIATLVGQIMPTLLPPCYAFFEVGCLLGNTHPHGNII